MNDLLIAYGLTIVFVFSLGLLFVLYRSRVGNKYIEAEKRLRMKLNEATSYFKGDTEKAPDFIGKAIGSIGIDGIMNELGIDPKLLNNPLVKGLIDKYAPRLLEKIGNAKSEGKEGTLL
jgi:hypothetical protein